MGVRDQLYSYQSSRPGAFNADRLGVISYNEKGGLQTNVWDFNPAEREAVEKRLQGIAARRFAFAEQTGDSIFALRAGMLNPYGSQPNGSQFNIRNMRDSGFDRLQYEANQKATEDVYREAREEEERNIRNEGAAARRRMSKDTGTAIAEAMSLRQDIKAFENSWDEFNQQMQGDLNRRTKDRSYSKWVGYRSRIHEGYEEERNALLGRGADAQTLATAAEKHEHALEQYRTALREAATGDKSDAIQAGSHIEDLMGSAYGNKKLSGIADGFKQITQSIQQAQ